MEKENFKLYENNLLLEIVQEIGNYGDPNNIGELCPIPVFPKESI